MEIIKDRVVTRTLIPLEHRIKKRVTVISLAVSAKVRTVFDRNNLEQHYCSLTDYIQIHIQGHCALLKFK